MVQPSKSETPGQVQSDLLSASLRPGNRVDLVLSRDEAQEKVEVRESRLLEVAADGRLILAQTDPPVSREYVGQVFEVTFLHRLRRAQKEQWLRVGYNTALLDAAADFELGPGERAAVLIVASPTALKPTNLRMYFRMVPPSNLQMKMLPHGLREVLEGDLRMFLERAGQDLEEKGLDLEEMLAAWLERIDVIREKIANLKKPYPIVVLDISQGGAKLAHPADLSLPLGGLLDVDLAWEDYSLNLTARVVRGGSLDLPGSAKLSFTGIQFIDLPLQIKQQLGRMLLDMARREKAKRAALEC
ncbi:MAG: PilZ domain-containing protein [Thermodesulfobacteriota bacterium]